VIFLKLTKSDNDKYEFNDYSQIINRFQSLSFHDQISFCQSLPEPKSKLFFCPYINIGQIQVICPFQPDFSDPSKTRLFLSKNFNDKPVFVNELGFYFLKETYISSSEWLSEAYKCHS